MFQHFGTRLKRDLKQLVDRRLDASVLASGSVLKVGLYANHVRQDAYLSKCIVNWYRGGCHLAQAPTVRRLVRRVPFSIAREFIHYCH